MRPEFADRYEQIVKYYKDEKIGIYDESVEMHNWLSSLEKNNESDFTSVINRRIATMKAKKGASYEKHLWCIAWINFNDIDYD